jgi:WhiB family redox-sensing transcriptional regulator
MPGLTRPLHNVEGLGRALALPSSRMSRRNPIRGTCGRDEPVRLSVPAPRRRPEQRPRGRAASDDVVQPCRGHGGQGKSRRQPAPPGMDGPARPPGPPPRRHPRPAVVARKVPDAQWHPRRPPRLRPRRRERACGPSWAPGRDAPGVDFFPELKTRKGAKQAERAKAVCVGCPVRQACLEAGLEERFGIWGGVNRAGAPGAGEREGRVECGPRHQRPTRRD